MQSGVIGLDYSNINTYKNKRINNLFKKISDEDARKLINLKVLDVISRLDVDSINTLFRNSTALVQVKLWKNDIIQRAILLGSKDLDKVDKSYNLIRNLENLKKVLKADSIKRQIYKYGIWKWFIC